MFAKRFHRSAAPFAFALFVATPVATIQPASAADAVPISPRVETGVNATSAASVQAKTAPEVTIVLREPRVPRARMRNRFVVTLDNSGGGPVSDADVRITLYNAGIPGPKGFFEHPGLTTVRLRQGEQPGTYEGTAVIPTRGAWQATVAVDQRGNRVAKETTNVWVR